MELTEKHKVEKKKEKMEKPEASETKCEEAETAAAKSIQAHPSDASKAGLMAKAVTAIEGMDKGEAAQWLDKALALIGHEADSIPDGTADKNRATIAAKSAVKEDFADLFGSEDLSEEFKEKTVVIFEAAVAARVAAERATIEEEFEKKFAEEIETISDNLADQIDQYLSYVAEEWKKDNEVAIDSSLRTDIAEEFISGLRNLFAEHYIEVPDEKVDAVDVLANEVQDLKDKLNEATKSNMEMTSRIQDYVKKEMFDEIANGLAMTQVDKLKSLVEGVEFDSPESYKKKIGIIKENYFSTTVKGKPTSFITEEVQDDTAEVKYVDKTIAKYASAISRTTKR